MNDWWTKVSKIVDAGDLANLEGNKELAINLWNKAKQLADEEINKKLTEIKKEK
jgi:hypothetical protein